MGSFWQSLRQSWRKGDLDRRLVQAAEEGDTQAVLSRLDEGAKIEARGREGMTALMLAARGGHAKAVRALLDRGASVRPKHSVGWSPLFDGVLSGSAETVRLLLERGADPTRRMRNTRSQP